MKKALLRYLNTFDNGDFQPINNFFVNEPVKYEFPIIIKHLKFLQKMELISVDDETNHSLELYAGNNPEWKDGSFPNKEINIKITDKGRAVIIDLGASNKEPAHEPFKTGAFLNKAVIRTAFFFITFLLACFLYIHFFLRLAF